MIYLETHETIEHVGIKQMYVYARKQARTQKNFSSDFHEF